MAAGILNLSLEQGATFKKRLEWRLAADEANPQGVPYDLTGCHAHMQIRDKVGGDIYMELRDGEGITLGGETGVIGLQITSDESAVFNWTSAVYDLYINFPSGEDYRLLKGKVTVDLAVTTPSDPPPLAPVVP